MGTEKEGLRQRGIYRGDPVMTEAAWSTVMSDSPTVEGLPAETISDVHAKSLPIALNSLEWVILWRVREEGCSARVPRCARQPGEGWPVKALGMQTGSHQRNRLQCGLETTLFPKESEGKSQDDLEGQDRCGGRGKRGTRSYYS